MSARSEIPQKTEARLHDGSTVEIEVYGQGPNLLLPVNPRPIEGPQADEIRKYGNDPALGQSLIRGLCENTRAGNFRVIAFDYEGQVMHVPKPQTLTPANVVADFLAVADAARAETFAYYGYSWLAVVGLQLASRTRRLAALAMGGFPPIHGPYSEMLRVTSIAHEMSRSARKPQAAEEDEWSSISLSEDQTQQFVTLYKALQGFDDVAIQAQITCPRLCFVGSRDEIQYGKQWGDVFISLVGPIINGRAELVSLGWEVRVLEGLDHIQAMQAAQVLPVLHSWLIHQFEEDSQE